MLLLQAKAWLLPCKPSISKGQEGKLHVSKLFHRQTLTCHITSCEHTTESYSGRQQTCKLQVQGVCQLHALQEDQQPLLPSWTSPTASGPLSGKLAAVMHVAVIRQDCLARHTVLMKPCASFLSPNMMRVKLDMIMRMKVIVRRNMGARENGD